MKVAASIVLFVALVHCSSGDAVATVCTLAFDGKTCSCKRTQHDAPGLTCSPLIVGSPALCCADASWPGEGATCSCDEIVCVTSAVGCVCGLASTRDKTGNEMAECPSASNDFTHCCVTAAGDCGCYPRTADLCPAGSTDVQACNFAATAHRCAAGSHDVINCE